MPTSTATSVATSHSAASALPSLVPPPPPESVQTMEQSPSVSIAVSTTASGNVQVGNAFPLFERGTLGSLEHSLVEVTIDSRDTSHEESQESDDGGDRVEADREEARDVEAEGEAEGGEAETVDMITNIPKLDNSVVDALIATGKAAAAYKDNPTEASAKDVQRTIITAKERIEEEKRSATSAFVQKWLDNASKNLNEIGAYIDKMVFSGALSRHPIVVEITMMSMGIGAVIVGLVALADHLLDCYGPQAHLVDRHGARTHLD